MLAGQFVMPRLHQDTCRPETLYPRRATCIRIHICRRIHVARLGYMLTVSLRHNYYSFRSMSRSTCIPQQTGDKLGDNFVADTRNMLPATSEYNLYLAIVSWCNAYEVTNAHKCAANFLPNLMPTTKNIEGDLQLLSQSCIVP